MEGFQLWDILLFGAIAVFILLRLRGTLGTRPEDSEEQDQERGSMWSARFGGEDKDDPANDVADDNVIRLPGSDAQPDAQASTLEDDFPMEIVAGVNEILLSDPHFDIEQFLDGSAAAYEMVINAFAKEDQATLRQLLADNIYDDFSSAIHEREQRGETLETTLVTIDDVEPIEIRMDGGHAEITIKFTAQMTNEVKGPDGETLSGSPDITDEVVDIWTFARDVRSRDPNWPLIATRKAN